MNLFETQSIINESTFKELKKYLMLRGFRIFFITFITLSACLFIVSALIRHYVLMTAMFILIIAVILDYIWTLNKNVKVNMKRLQETIHAKECVYTTSFSETGFKIINHVANATATIAYDDINRFIETENYYALFTKANQFGLVNKSDIDSTDKREELINYLKQSCKKIRWQLAEKR